VPLSYQKARGTVKGNRKAAAKDTPSVGTVSHLVTTYQDLAQASNSYHLCRVCFLTSALGMHSS
jgi:hypothetical protein